MPTSHGRWGRSRGPYVYGTALWDEGRLRPGITPTAARTELPPESSDGITWTKPELGLVEFAGSKANNIVVGAGPAPDETPPYPGQGQCHNPSVIKRPWEKDPAKRYALFCYGQEYRWARVAFSPDGRRWTFAPETREKGLFSSSDVLNFLWDPYKARYVATWKSGNRRGRAVGVAWSGDGLSWRSRWRDRFVADDPT